MVKSKLTDQTKTSKQSSPRQGAKIDTFLIHHQAGTSDDAVIKEMVTASKQVSANYTISNEGRLTSVVPEELRAWTSGSTQDGGKGAAWDRRSITVEIENQTAAPDWKISDKAIQTAAKLLHDLKSRYDIEHVYGHRDLWNKFEASYATFCPGPDTVARVIDAEKAIKDEPVKKPTPKPKPDPKPDNKPEPKPTPAKKYVFKLPKSTIQVRVQRALARHGFYNGPLDGDMEKMSLRGVQMAVKKYAGYDGDVDGDPQELTGKAVQKFARAKGGYTGRAATLDEASWIGFATALERTP